MNLTALEDFFRGRPAMAVAVSGGVDSMTLAVVAARAQPETQIFHAISPAVPAAATARVRRYAELENWQLTVIDAGEMQDENYLANPANRCYFCKTNLYDTVTERTDLIVASGTNLDDLSDYRPGLVAAEEHQVCHPYVELKIDKSGLRAIAAQLKLDDLKDLPAAPCLSSRVLTGIAIDAEMLPLVDAAEQEIWQRHGQSHEMKAVRCRIRDKEVGLQIDSTQPLQAETKSDIISYVHALFADQGYAEQVTIIVIEPYKMGSAFLVEAVDVTE